MGRIEVACRRFAVLSGIRQEPGSYTSCVLPKGAVGQRRGLLALVTEPAGDHPSLAVGACNLVQETITRQYYSEAFLSLTSGLLRAIGSANEALLHYNYTGEVPGDGGGSAGVAVQTGGVRTRRAQVGLTAVLLRPDGLGIYLAQMAPTQAYLVHNGTLSALPEPADWQRGGKVAVTLKRVPQPGETADETDEDSGELGSVPLPALPLGSGPAVDVDLIYRRIEPGDIVAIVSSSLARHLDRRLAEEIFASGDPDRITDALYNLAAEHGLARSHACVLQLGAETTSGVDTDIVLPVAMTSESIDMAGGSAVDEPSEKAPHVAPSLANVLKGPKEWFARRKGTLAGGSEQTPDSFIEEPFFAQQSSTEEDQSRDQSVAELPQPPQSTEVYLNPHQPTEVLLQHSLDLPPFRAAAALPPSSTANEELEFDGWEDSPPVLHGRSGRQTGGKEVRAWTHGTSALEQATSAPHDDGEEARPRQASRGLYSVPSLFPTEDDEEQGFLTFPQSGREANAGAQPGHASPMSESRASKAATMLHDASGWANRVAGSFVPDRSTRERKPKSAGVSGIGGRTIPVRPLIIAGTFILLVVLSFSILRSAGNPKHDQAVRLLTDARQEETLGNQPMLTLPEKLQHLQAGMQKARQAQEADPALKDAGLLAATIQGEIDTLQGISRVDTKLLFDLTDPDKATQTAQPGQVATDTGAAVTTPVTNTGHLAQILVQGNDAYVLDSERGRVFRCRLAARDCTTALQTGDDAGGKKVGPLLAMTLRVGNLVVIDSGMTLFIYSAENSSWQAQTLGGAGTIDKPRDMASYDGNLYLLGSKPGQILKYGAGRYGEGPEEWIKDPASSDQVKDGVSMSIDGVIYVLLPDGKIQVLQGGKLTRTLPAAPGGSSPATSLFTGTDLSNLYVMRASDGTVTRIGKEGQLVATLKPSGEALNLTGMTVDEGRGKLYLLQGRRVYEAGLSARKALPTGNTAAPAQTGANPAPAQQQPSTRPTAEP